MNVNEVTRIRIQTIPQPTNDSWDASPYGETLCDHGDSSRREPLSCGLHLPVAADAFQGKFQNIAAVQLIGPPDKRRPRRAARFGRLAP